ncbi:uncharacterized protein MELLADRAFT_88891 [Melampsora larici-populina 98AG31]|uniref:AAA+ ATPase domain-containing protein n=1 Tax=Melampsora larici-populina (strain 98AG31 / pathotype 3-4-7) TaxID=747676 RepID=F4R664_MELLP|nr:uncharacterized protein MELLADRAFT_88891 [Melampsora larici-populina 98AG31]EGG12523.1 hypothetical protein MELLADRAFT_88891 [Melampsora larici-populina 98AG31]
MPKRSNSITTSHELPSSRPSRTRKPPTPIYPHGPQYDEQSTRPKRSSASQIPHRPVDSHARTRAAHNVIGAENTQKVHQNGYGSASAPDYHSQDQYINSDERDAEGEDDDQDEDQENHTYGHPDSGSEYNGDKDDAEHDRSVSIEHPPSDCSGAVVKKKAKSSRSKKSKITSTSDEGDTTPEEEEEEEDRISIHESDEDDLPLSSRAQRKTVLDKLATQRKGANHTSGATRRSTRGLKNKGDESETAQNAHEEHAGRTLRTRDKKVNYEIAAFPIFESTDKPRSRKSGGKDIRLPYSMSGKQYDQFFGQARPGHDSDEETGAAFTANKLAGAGILGGAAASTGLFGGGLFDPGNMGGGGPSNMGKMSGATNLADTDPLGVQTNIDFSHVGGMEHHIQQLKEMVSLPLLYPEVFQRFQITPPRGVLFHGPPGTGKTLLARALAASCSSEGQKIAFFMRKGADCLSKWVGEAERQLRLLFEEAKNCQPSIIFFDEIDGLAPVRSSKQEQIHASIVSTLLSLMDGMDGRGQVVIIGATNRPDAVDPALRRPGRFDREFYFPLPNRDARLSIIDIHTRGWDPPLENSFKSELAELTKGYGGADLRALCTEAAMNAVQRIYPQIYKSTDRLVIDPKNINVVARDFTIAQKHLIPSTSRSSSSAASPLPPQLLPLLATWLERAKETLSKILPDIKKPNVLEEAEYEEDAGGGFEREKMIQSFETLRVFRPRMIISGPQGCGQSYIGSAILHHLEGYHVQTLDLANLISDSTISPDARAVQIFTEAKRHKPSVLYIPALHNWNAPILEGVKATITSLLDELKSSDPILLLGIVNCPMNQLPSSVRSWFGITKTNRIVLEPPDLNRRESFFAETFASINRPPNRFPDGIPRKKRILEVLPKAPPRAPHRKLVEYLKFRLGPVLNELKKKHKRFTKSIGPDPTELARLKEEAAALQAASGAPPPLIEFYNIDLDGMHYKLYYSKYLTSQQFIADVERIVHNAELDSQLSGLSDRELPVKAQAMLTHTKIMVEQACDQQFDFECARMYERMKLRDPKLGQEKKKDRVGSGVIVIGADLPTRQSNRNSGKEPEYSYNPDLSERGIKRLMEVEDIGDEERQQKRSKADEEIQLCESNDHQDQNLPQHESIVEQITAPISNLDRSTSPSYEPGEAPPMQTFTDLQAPQAGPSSSLNFLNNGQGEVGTFLPNENSLLDGTEIEELPMMNEDLEEEEAERIEEMIKEEEEFVVPEDELNELMVNLVEESEGLVVDELEELRAGLYEIIWRFRSDWNRMRMIDGLREFLKMFLEGIRLRKVDELEQEEEED